MTHTPPTNRGLWLARHTRNQYHGNPCHPDCPICTDNRQASHNTPPPPRGAA